MNLTPRDHWYLAVIDDFYFSLSRVSVVGGDGLLVLGIDRLLALGTNRLLALRANSQFEIGQFEIQFLSVF